MVDPPGGVPEWPEAPLAVPTRGRDGFCRHGRLNGAGLECRARGSSRVAKGDGL